MESAPVTTETTDQSFRPTVRSWKRWGSVVERILAGDPAGSEELYEMLRTGFYCSLWSQGPQDAEDRVHDVFLQTVKAVQAGQLREPERLPGFVATITRRVIAQQIEKRVNTQRRTADIPQMEWLRDSRLDPEASLAEREELEVAMRVLGGLKLREREILDRFYIQEQSPAQIQSEMHLTETTYRVNKCLAMKRFKQRGQAMLGAVGAS